MYRGIVYMWLHKGWRSPLRKSASFITCRNTSAQKSVQYLTTEYLSLRQESDISDMFDIISSDMCLWWTIVEVCGFHTIKFFSMTIPILTNQRAYACYRIVTMVSECNLLSASALSVASISAAEYHIIKDIVPFLSLFHKNDIFTKLWSCLNLFP